MLSIGGAALAGMVFGASATKADAQSVTYTDNDILNFALNLEYLESNFYYLAAFGCTIDKPNAAAIAAGAPSAGIPITITGGGVGTAGTVNTTGAGQVPFGNTSLGITVGSYATETAIEEGKHVIALQGALGSLAVNQPAINLSSAVFASLAGLAGVSGAAGFSPYASSPYFLVGAYIFEDVGVTAYHGAASLLTSSANLTVAAGILAVEAYHAGLIRTSISYMDPTNAGIGSYTGLISTLRASLAQSALLGVAPSAYDTNPDDFGLATFSTSLAGAATVTSTRLTDADGTNIIAFSRNTTQVLNIVTGGGAVNTTVTPNVVISPATGVFFPAGLNGLFK
jgi:hypothetical protein